MAHATFRKFLVWAAVVCFLSLSVYGEDAPAPIPTRDSTDVAATHDAIRTLRDTLIEATNKKDIETLISLVHADVVLTAQDGDKLVSVRKRDGVRDYMQRLLTGPEAAIRSMAVKPTVDEMTILHGDETGIAYGSSTDHYVLRDGTEFDLDTRWSATLILTEGKWQIANLHVSSNLFDNPITRAMAKLPLYIGIAAGVLGVVCGLIIVRLVRGRGQTNAS